MKTCTKCGETKPVDAFHFRSVTKGIRVNMCRCCTRDYQAAYRSANSERLLADKARYYRENREVLLTAREAYRQQNPDAHKIWSEKNRESIAARKAKWHAENRDKIAEGRRERYAKHPERFQGYSKKYAAKNPHAVAAFAATRRSRKLRATPSWANLEKVGEFYESAEGLRMLTGEWYHVDHIVPLQGKTVCGLHNEFNLQILPAIENIRKGNKHA